MAYSADWGQRIVTIPRADMPVLQASPEVRSLTMSDFRAGLHTLQDSEDGIVEPPIHRRIDPYTISGITYLNAIEVINDWQIEFEDGVYTVVLSGGNTNILDVKVENSVGVLGNNSAAAIEVSALSDAESAALTAVQTGVRELRAIAGLIEGATSRLAKDSEGNPTGLTVDGEDITILIGTSATEETADRQP